MEAHFITVEQDKMIEMLLAGMNISDISKKLNIARSTVYTWKDKIEIKAELDKRRQGLKKTAQARIVSDVCTYVDNMRDLACSSGDIRVKFQANKYLIDQCLGAPGTAKEDANIVSEERTADKNTLKQELDNIKNLSLVK